MEVWYVVVAIGTIIVPILIAAIPWAFAVQSKLGSIVAKLDALVNELENQREGQKRVWERIDDHEHRITVLEQ